MLIFVAKLARVPLAPDPELSYSWKVTSCILAVLLDHTDQPAPLMMSDRLHSWKQTRAYSVHAKVHETR